MSHSYTRRPISGIGIGLRHNHFSTVLKEKPNVGWFEILGDNYLKGGGIPLEHIKAIRATYPMTIHTVGLSLGSAEPLNQDYLNRLKQLIDVVQPMWLSDHLCWTQSNKHVFHDLLPLPYIDEAIDEVVAKIKTVKKEFGIPFLLENVSSYLQFKESVMPEWEFIRKIVEKAECGLLLDINNIVVSAKNQNFNAETYLEHIPVNAVKQFHLAGYTDMGTHYIDTHGEAIHNPVWSLYEKALERFGEVPTLIEWDNNIPPLQTMLEEAEKAADILETHAAVMMS